MLLLGQSRQFDSGPSWKSTETDGASKLETTSSLPGTGTGVERSLRIHVSISRTSWSSSGDGGGQDGEEPTRRDLTDREIGVCFPGHSQHERVCHNDQRHVRSSPWLAQKVHESHITLGPL